MRGKVIITSIALFLYTSSKAQERISREEYIETYAELAMNNMRNTGIPASITLAQGCLESDNGNSRLARKANNHFGIKCHDWEGKRIYHNDDEKNECFRKYGNPGQSYDDHSLFITTTPRYQFLFELKPDDYKGWARGLKNAGYATSRKYADLLIGIIEDNELYAYDEMVLSGDYKPGKARERAGAGPSRQVLQNNRIDYIIVETGDTPASLRKEFDLYPFEIFRYNDLERGETPEPGTIIYLQPKRFKAAKGNEIHIVEENQTMRDISQKYGIRLNRLYRLNNLDKGTKVEPGTEIWLRRSRPEIKENNREKPAREQEKNPGLEFEFDGI
ncbi:MAG: glucosaminidase domain-containing protein [Bacteroidales bacterium]|nr:glucosaminidase domain-containing protein [Bacteroidales bacterium]